MEKGIKSKLTSLDILGLSEVKNALWNASSDELTKITLRDNLGKLTDTGCLAVDTGEFTGRSPKDRFVVYDDFTKDTVWWEGLNNKFDSNKFDSLHKKMLDYFRKS